MLLKKRVINVLIINITIRYSIKAVIYNYYNILKIMRAKGSDV